MQCFIKASLKGEKCLILILLKEKDLLFSTQIENCSNSYSCTWKGLKVLYKLLEYIKNKNPQKHIKIQLFLNNEAVLGQLKGLYKIREEEEFKIKNSIKPFLEEIEYGSFPEQYFFLIKEKLKEHPNYPEINAYKISGNSLTLIKSIKFKEKQTKNTLF